MPKPFGNLVFFLRRRPFNRVALDFVPFMYSTAVGLPSKLCGTTMPEEIDNSKQFTTVSRYLRIEYYGNKPPVGSGFSLIFQHFADRKYLFA